MCLKHTIGKKPTIEKKNAKEIIRLKNMLHSTNNPEEIKDIEGLIKICEVLNWKDYNSIYRKR